MKKLKYKYSRLNIYHLVLLIIYGLNLVASINNANDKTQSVQLLICGLVGLLATLSIFFINIRKTYEKRKVNLSYLLTLIYIFFYAAILQGASC